MTVVIGNQNIGLTDDCNFFLYIILYEEVSFFSIIWGGFWHGFGALTLTRLFFGWEIRIVNST